MRNFAWVKPKNMSELTIRKVENKDDLRRFIRFNYELYKNCKHAVPDFYEDTLATFDKTKNAAFEFCECEWFLAFRDGKTVGRVCAIINHRANDTWGKSDVRFGWIDFIDDQEVADGLIHAVEDWGRKRGMKEIVGPLGFTDMDPEGMLVEGFDELGTMVTIYNYSYYPRHIERMGFRKDADWCERLVVIPTKEHPAQSEKFFRIASIVEKRWKLRTLHFKNTKEIIQQGWGMKIFHLINRAYAPLYGFSQMTDRQCEQYVQQYIPFVDVRSIAVIVNEANDLIGIGIGIPSLSQALQKAKSRLWPFGWWHLAKVIYMKRFTDTVDLLLIAVAPEYQGKGVNAMVFADLIKRIGSMGFKYAEVAPILEDNNKSADQWQYVDSHIFKRRRCWRKKIDE